VPHTIPTKGAVMLILFCQEDQVKKRKQSKRHSRALRHEEVAIHVPASLQQRGCHSYNVGGRAGGPQSWLIPLFRLKPSIK
jgi:hypothetical protein